MTEHHVDAGHVQSPERPAPRPRQGDPRTSPGRRRGRAAAQLVSSALALWVLLAGTGLLLTRVLSPSAPPASDAEIEGWLAAQRTPLGDTLTSIGSSLSDTTVCIAVATIVVVALRLWFGRWYESAVVVTAIAGELLVFLAVTATVERARPEVPHLDAAPPTSSFPSGHTAAAIALYGCIAVIAYGRLRPGLGRTLLTTLLFAVPVVVGLSRLYRGMHFPSDVLAGLVGGGLWLVVVVLVLLPAPAERSPHAAVARTG